MRLRELLKRVPVWAWVVLAPALPLVVLVVAATTWSFIRSWHRIGDGASRASARVERFVPKPANGDCSAMPEGARDVIHTGPIERAVQVGTDKGPCRDECRMVTRSAGARTTTDRVCKTVCESKPRFGLRSFEQCRYTADVWELVSDQVAVGRELGTAVTWPLPRDLPLTPEAKPIPERVVRSVRYEFLATGLFGRESICHFWNDDERWAALERDDWFRMPTVSQSDLICTERRSACNEPAGATIPMLLCGP